VKAENPTSGSVGKKSQRSGILSLERAAEGFGVASQPFQPDVPIQSGIGWR